jgi:hypothetical protein
MIRDYIFGSQELSYNPKIVSRAAVAKAQVAARSGGSDLQAKADEGLATGFELRNSSGTITQPNAAAKYVAATTESGLYPSPPFDSSKRQLAGVIDAWIDFAATEVQLRLREVTAAVSKAVGMHAADQYSDFKLWACVQQARQSIRALMCNPGNRCRDEAHAHWSSSSGRAAEV